MRLIFLFICIAVVLPSCVSYKPDRGNTGWVKTIIETEKGGFDLVSFAPPQLIRSETLTIYIEGDGFAWRNRRTPSHNPTPRHPIALDLAMSDKRDDTNIVYLARPCQYIDLETQSMCSAKYWTSHRFSEEVIVSSNAAIDHLVTKYGAKHIYLIGYSGGGAVATLIAARRDDVAQLITIAGNLDTDAWTQHHEISPLYGSLNPANHWHDLVDISQTHYIGEADKIMPAAIAQSYSSKFPAQKKPQLVVLKDTNHKCCWSEVRL